jgi:hypothetical protein
MLLHSRLRSVGAPRGEDGREHPKKTGKTELEKAEKTEQTEVFYNNCAIESKTQRQKRPWFS